MSLAADQRKQETSVIDVSFRNHSVALETLRHIAAMRCQCSAAQKELTQSIVMKKSVEHEIGCAACCAGESLAVIGGAR